MAGIRCGQRLTLGLVGEMIGLLRVRNEERWIERSIASILPICERVLVMNDHSTDATLEICAGISGVEVFASPFEGLNETRDKNWLLDKARCSGWVLMIDGDETLAPGAAEIIQREIANPAAVCLSPKILYLWDSEGTIRTDGVYGRFRRPSIFQPGAHQFESTHAGGNFHCGNVPLALQSQASNIDAAFLHFGYLHRHDRIRKYGFYNNADPNNYSEDLYRHIVQGDIPEVSASAKLKHAGPLRLEALCSQA